MRPLLYLIPDRTGQDRTGQDLVEQTYDREERIGDDRRGQDLEWRISGGILLPVTPAYGS